MALFDYMKTILKQVEICAKIKDFKLKYNNKLDFQDSFA